MFKFNFQKKNLFLMSKAAERQGLQSPKRLHARLSPTRRSSLISNPRLSNVSDMDLIEIRNNIQNEIEEVKKAGEIAKKALRDQNILENKFLAESLKEKENCIILLQEQIVEAQDRFIWDLSLAIKQYLVQEKGASTMQGIAISQIPIQHVIENFDEEEPEPEQWEQWIKDKFNECQQ